MRLLPALAVTVLVGCVFDRSGVPLPGQHPETGADLPVLFEGGDRAVPKERWIGDPGSLEWPKADRRRPDLADQKPATDKGLPTPIAAAALGLAFSTTKVPCVKSDGTQPGTTINIVDTSTVAFFEGAVTLTSGAGLPTQQWVAGASSVIVVFNPNACDQVEDPAGGSDWRTGGLLIRKASLQVGLLLLQPGCTIQDLNAMNVNSDGTFQVDYFEPDDSKLGDFPQLVQPITRAKELILLLGNL